MFVSGNGVLFVGQLDKFASILKHISTCDLHLLWLNRITSSWDGCKQRICDDRLNLMLLFTNEKEENSRISFEYEAGNDPPRTVFLS